MRLNVRDNAKCGNQIFDLLSNSSTIATGQRLPCGCLSNVRCVISVACAQKPLIRPERLTAAHMTVQDADSPVHVNTLLYTSRFCLIISHFHVYFIAKSRAACIVDVSGSVVWFSAVGRLVCVVVITVEVHARPLPSVVARTAKDEQPESVLILLLATGTLTT